VSLLVLTAVTRALKLIPSTPSRLAESLATELSPATSLDANDGPSQYNSDHSTDFQVEGRHIFNLWRLLRGDLNLNQYTIENVAFHLLHRR